MAGASAYARYRAMRTAYRQERVIARLALSGFAGSMTAGLFDWPTGIAVAVAVLLAHSLYVRVKPDSRTRWRRGAAAERRTGRHLARLDPAYFHVLHDRALPGASHVNLDHLVIGLTGVYAIASRRWPPFTRLRAGERLCAGGRPLGRLIGMSRRTAHTVADLLADEVGRDVDVCAVIAVHGARMPHTGILFAGVAFQRAKRVQRLLERQPAVYTTAQVAGLAAAAERALPPMIDVSRKTTTQGD